MGQQGPPSAKKIRFSKIIDHIECQNKCFWRGLSLWWPVLALIKKSQNALETSFLGQEMGQKWVKNVFFQK